MTTSDCEDPFCQHGVRIYALSARDPCFQPQKALGVNIGGGGSIIGLASRGCPWNGPCYLRMIVATEWPMVLAGDCCPCLGVVQKPRNIFERFQFPSYTNAQQCSGSVFGCMGPGSNPG